MANNNLVFTIALFCLLNFTNAFTHFPSYDDTDGTTGTLTLNDFGPNGDGGGPCECDGRFHPLPQRVAALSTEWYNHGTMCGQTIKITARNGRSAFAKVVDECDTSHGCKNNVVDVSKTVWHDLGLNIDAGEVSITWTVA